MNGILRVDGKGGHAGSSHQRSWNAIVEVSRFISHLASLTNYANGITVNVATVSGGQQTNRVPNSAYVTFEARAPTAALLSEVREEVTSLVSRSNEQYEDERIPCRVSVEFERDIPPPWPRNGGTDRLLGHWTKAAAHLGYSIEPEARGGGSDANFFAQYCPAIDGLGVGGSNAHCSEGDLHQGKDQEYFLVDSIVPKAILNALAIVSILRES